MESPVSDWSKLLEDLDVLLPPQPPIVEETPESTQNDTSTDNPRNILLHQGNGYSPGTENWFRHR